MLDYFVFSHWALGNTAIQLAAAIQITSTLSRTGQSYKIQPFSEPIGSSAVKLLEDHWEQLEPFVKEASTQIPPHLHQFVEYPIIQFGYYQRSNWYVQERDTLLKRFRSEFGEFQLSKGGTTVAQAMTAPPPFELRPTDIAIHVRLGDYRETGWVLDPAPQIQILRRLREQDPVARIFLVTQEPRTPEERNYLKLFEEVRPILQCGSELEDFALLRSVPRLVITNSTFSWVAGWMAEQPQERWIPEPRINELGAISSKDHLYKAEHGYDLDKLSIPQSEYLPVTGEFLQSLCEYTVLTRNYKEEMHKWINLACPPQRQLFTGEDWPARVVSTARSLFVYPDIKNIEAVLTHSWPALKLLVIHNSDITPPQELLNRFLEAHPQAHAWVQNATGSHSRQRILPIGLENRIWRNGRREIEGAEQEIDAPVQLHRPSKEERPYEILCTHNWPTNPIRPVWQAYLEGHCRGDSRIMVLPRVDITTYSEMLLLGRAVLCPPGNGLDTHRAWEVLQSGGYPILLNSPHTSLLKAQYPSLPLLSISEIEEIHTLEIPPESPSEFHPLLLREYWMILFRSHLEATNEK